MSLAAQNSRAVSQGDKYFSLLVGGVPHDQKFQATLLGGRSFFDEFGAGLVVDGTFSGYQVSAELRWFFEPFEVAVGAGTAYSHENHRHRLLLSASVSYLWSVAKNLALKSDFRGQFFIRQRSLLCVSAGLRYIF